ncbi:MAG TPA: hypothetical protein VGM91_05345 [Conexibacter sp.]
MLEPEGSASDPLDRAIAAEEHAAGVERFTRPKSRERRDLLLHAALELRLAGADDRRAGVLVDALGLGDLDVGEARGAAGPTPAGQGMARPVEHVALTRA